MHDIQTQHAWGRAWGGSVCAWGGVVVTWLYSSSLIGQMPLGLAWRCASLASRCCCTASTSEVVAGVLETYCTHSLPPSVHSRGGRMEFSTCSVEERPASSLARMVFTPLASLVLVPTRMGLLYRTRLCGANVRDMACGWVCEECDRRREEKEEKKKKYAGQRWVALSRTRPHRTPSKGYTAMSTQRLCSTSDTTSSCW
jgi:hypothetical protein